MKKIHSLFLLQCAQLDHDSFAHQEIHNADLQKKLNHYVLHFFKYASHLNDITQVENDVLKNEKQQSKEQLSLKHIRDTFLLLIATGNAFNTNWNDIFNHPYTDFRDLLKTYYTDSINSDNYVDIAFKAVLKNGAKLAKVIESIDHMEPIHIKNQFLDGSHKMLLGLMPVMAFMQESLGIDFEENIFITHAAIKAKKPWCNILYMNSHAQGILIDNNIFPSLNFYAPFEDNVELIKKSLTLLRENSHYTHRSNIEIQHTAVDVPVIKDINNELIKLQILQNKKELEEQFNFNSYVSPHIKTHIENCSFRFLTKTFPISEQEDQIIEDIKEGFGYLISMATKLNIRLDKYLQITQSPVKNFTNLFSQYSCDQDKVLSNTIRLNSSLANWHIQSSMTKEDNDNMTTSFLSIYEKILKNTIAGMINIEKKYGINLYEQLLLEERNTHYVIKKCNIK